MKADRKKILVKAALKEVYFVASLHALLTQKQTPEQLKMVGKMARAIANEAATGEELTQHLKDD